MPRKKILYLITKATWGEALRSAQFWKPTVSNGLRPAFLNGELPFPDPLTHTAPL